MKLSKLNKKWDNISETPEIKGFKALRISASCIPDLYIAQKNNGYRCLILFLPTEIDFKFKGKEKERLTIDYLSEKNALIIRLNDFDFIDLFNELILSLYHRIKNISNSEIYSKELVMSFYKWVEFFEDKQKSVLSKEEIKGLWGELFILREFIDNSKDKEINNVLDSWKGLYDKTNDFVFDYKNVEVKTKEESKPYVKISSEYQLNNEFDKGLELLVLSVSIDYVNGSSIYDILKDIINISRERYGDLTIIHRALSQKGLTIEICKEYNNNRFIAIEKKVYNCDLEGFPRLSKSNIPEHVSNLSYKMRVNTLDCFVSESKKY